MLCLFHIVFVLWDIFMSLLFNLPCFCVCISVRSERVLQFIINLVSSSDVLIFCFIWLSSCIFCLKSYPKKLNDVLGASRNRVSSPLHFWQPIRYAAKECGRTSLLIHLSSPTGKLSGSCCQEELSLHPVMVSRLNIINKMGSSCDVKLWLDYLMTVIHQVLEPVFIGRLIDIIAWDHHWHWPNTTKNKLNLRLCFLYSRNASSATCSSLEVKPCNVCLHDGRLIAKVALEGRCPRKR